MPTYEPPEEYAAANRLREYHIDKLRGMVAEALGDGLGDMDVHELSADQCVTILIGEGIYR